MHRSRRALMAATAALTMLLTAPVSASASPVDPASIDFWGKADWSPDLILTPADPEFWNPFIGKTRVVSPFGRSTKIFCSSRWPDTNAFRCFQADPQGGVHSLTPVPSPSDALGALVQHPAAMFVYFD